MASTFTPTAASATIAGFGFYALVWSIASHLDTIMALFGLGHRGYAKKVRQWINKNKALTLCITEVINFTIHGITHPAAVTFAIGGTIFNLLYVMIINPIICWREDRKTPVNLRPIRKEA